MRARGWHTFRFVVIMNYADGRIDADAASNVRIEHTHSTRVEASDTCVCVWRACVYLIRLLADVLI